MREFRTTFNIEESKHKIDYNSHILSMGSCFSENIGQQLLNYKFCANINPFGILYNPESIAQSLNLLLKNKPFKEDQLFTDGSVWNSFNYHSRFSSVNKVESLQKMNVALGTGADFLQKTDFLILTFGTAWVYEYKKTGKIVANCHKVPAKEFSRFRLSVCDVVEKFKPLIKTLKNNNLNLKIILTVSPIRHLKDGVTENQLSKSILLMAVNELVQSFEKVMYFPSYELMMDDLRDYRFYADDMTHPSALAVDYIWEHFKRTFVLKSAYPAMTEIQKIKQAEKHRPFQAEAQEYQTFLHKNIKKIEQLMHQYPHLDFTNELHYFNEKISNTQTKQ